MSKRRVGRDGKKLKMAAIHCELNFIRIEISNKCLKTEEEQEKIIAKDRLKATFD